MFDSRVRDALDAESAGDLRRAANLWRDSGDVDKAAELLMKLGDSLKPVAEKISAWQEALRLVAEEGSPMRRDLEGRIGNAILDTARARGATTRESRERLLEAAQRLERAHHWPAAADCYELLGDERELARCLELGGEIERLEKVLDLLAAREHKQDRLRSLLGEQESMILAGARHLARNALREAVSIATDQPSLAELLRRLEERWPHRGRLRVEIGGVRHTFIGRLPAVLGRSEGDIILRGTSVSRRHCELDRQGDVFVVRDLGSRNGTLIAQMPIHHEIELSGPTEIGLGDDVSVLVTPSGQGLGLRVLKGMDRGEQIWVGEGPFDAPAVPATFTFLDDRVVLTARQGVSTTLGGRRIFAPIDLLIGDRVDLDGTPIEVLE